MLNEKKILIVESLGLGDLIMKTPFLRALKKKYPKVSISFAAKPNYCEILRRLPYIDNVYEYKHGGGFLQKWKFAAKMQGQDYIVFFSVSEQLLLGARLLRIPHVFGMGKPKYVKRGLLHQNFLNYIFITQQYAAKTCAEMLCDLLQVQLDVDFYDIEVPMPNSEECTIVDDILSEQGLLHKDYICMAPFGNGGRNDIPLQYAGEIVQRIENELRLPVVMIGGKENFSAAMTTKAACVLTGKTSLMEMVEVIRRAKLFLGIDSGPTHVAGALGVPILSLFYLDLPSRWLPHKEHVHVLTMDMPCKPCKPSIAETCELGRKCVFDITPDRVMEALRAHEALGIDR